MKRLSAVKLLSEVTSSAGLMMAFSSLCRAAGYLLPVPLMYVIMTPAEVAFWLSAVSLVAMQNIMFVGLPQTFVRAISFADAGSNSSATMPSATIEKKLKVDDLNHVVAIVFGSLSAIHFILLATLGTWILWEPIKNTANPSDSLGAWTFITIFSIVRVDTMRSLTFLNGIGDVAIPRAFDGAAWLLGGVFAAMALAISSTLTLAALAACLPATISLIALGTRTRRLGWTRKRGVPDWPRVGPIFGSIWQPAWRTGLGTLLSAGARQGTGLLFVQVGDPVSSAAYLLAQNVINFAMIVSAAPVQSSIHLMTRAYAQGDRKGQQDLLRSSLSSSLWVAVLLSGGLGLAAFPLLQATALPHLFVTPQMWSVMCITLLLQRYGAVHLQAYSVTNHIIWHWLDGITGAINIAVAVVFLNDIGLWAIVLGNLASIILLYFWIPAVYSHRLLNMSWPSGDIAGWWKPAMFCSVSIMLMLVHDAYI